MKAVWPSVFVAVLGLALGGSLATRAFAQGEEAGPPARLLLAPATPLPPDGLYVANDSVPFLLEKTGSHVRLRFAASDEVFYLSSEPAPLGGRVLKYDTGEVALQVAGWGGVTLYTEEARSGMPAERQGDPTEFNPKPVAAKDMRQFAANLAQELSSKSDLAIGFAADWADLARSDAKSDERRALACDAMRDAAYAIMRLARKGMHSVLEKGLHIVRVMQGPKPAASMQRGVLTVSYTPQSGPSARPSSLAIANVVQASL